MNQGKWGRILALRFGNIALIAFGLLAVVLAVLGLQRGGEYLESIRYGKVLALFTLCLAGTLLAVSILSGFKKTLSLRFWIITLACYALLGVMLFLHSSAMFAIHLHEGVIATLPRIPPVGVPLPAEACEKDGPFLRLKEINEESVGKLLDSRPAFLLFSASWCHPCQRLKKDMNALIQRRGEAAVPLYLIMLEKPEHSKEAHQAMRARGGDFTGIPTLIYQLGGHYYIQTGYSQDLIVQKGPSTVWQYLNPFIQTTVDKIIYAN